MTLDDITGYPCPFVYSGRPCTRILGSDCRPGYAACEVFPIYRAHIALRKAVLGDMTAGEAAEMYHGAASICGAGMESKRRYFNVLADVVEGLDA